LGIIAHCSSPLVSNCSCFVRAESSGVVSVGPSVAVRPTAKRRRSEPGERPRALRAPVSLHASGLCGMSPPILQRTAGFCPARGVILVRIVMKFGGTSVASVERIRQSARHVKREVDAGHQVSVVVSAMSGKTNELIGWVNEASKLHD